MAEEKGENERLSEQQQQIAYELFKFQWMMAHGYTISKLMASIMRYTTELWEGTELTEKEIEQECQNWENDVGLDGSIWPCFDEFRETDLKYIDLNSPENKRYMSMLAAFADNIEHPQEETKS